MSTITHPDTLTLNEQFRTDVIEGLSRPRKSLPCKHFYDARGSALFDRICELDEYYLTRTENDLMCRYGDQMGEAIGPGILLIEYGSGSSTKTRVLLDSLADPAGYVPVDISREHLLGTADQLRDEFPHLEVLPVVADFTQPFDLPTPDRQPSGNTIYFPGSTIGNFEKAEAERLLKQIAQQCGSGQDQSGGGLLIGIDLQKDVQTLENAYNDSRGITAEFNLNLLHRLENELGATLDIDAFKHEAVYNDQESRIEIFIRSTKRQQIELGDAKIGLEQNELIHTENSHKYTVDGFVELASRAGFTLRESWTDPRSFFAVLYLQVDSPVT